MNGVGAVRRWWHQVPARDAVLALLVSAALLYGSDGRLAFSGGLTSVRGHAGDSFGQERIVSLITTGAADRAESAVFGCPLDDDPPDETPSKEQP